MGFVMLYISSQVTISKDSHLSQSDNGGGQRTPGLNNASMCPWMNRILCCEPTAHLQEQLTYTALIAHKIWVGSRDFIN